MTATPRSRRSEPAAQPRSLYPIRRDPLGAPPIGGSPRDVLRLRSGSTFSSTIAASSPASTSSPSAASPSSTSPPHAAYCTDLSTEPRVTCAWMDNYCFIACRWQDLMGSAVVRGAALATDLRQERDGAVTASGFGSLMRSGGCWMLGRRAGRAGQSRRSARCSSSLARSDSRASR